MQRYLWHILLFLSFHLLRTLALSISNHTTILPFTTKLQQCIPQRPPLDDQVPTASYSDCIRAILQWSSVPDRNKPITFSRDPRKGYQLPHKVPFDSCVLVIDTVTQTSVDMASVADLAREAGTLAKECVLKGDHTGGVAWVGAEGWIELILHGGTGSNGVAVE